MKITLQSGSFGWDYLIVAEDGRDCLVQTNTDYPGVASTFGWSPSRAVFDAEVSDQLGDPLVASCEHDGTDGTIDCPACGMTRTEFIQSAQEWLDDHIGEEAEDPGYFGEEE